MKLTPLSLAVLALKVITFTSAQQATQSSLFFCNLFAPSNEQATLTITVPSQATAENPSGVLVSQSRPLSFKECQTIAVPQGIQVGDGLPLSVSVDDQTGQGQFILKAVNAYNVVFAVASSNNSTNLAFPAALETSSTIKSDTIFFGQYGVGYEKGVDFELDGQVTATNVQHLQPYTPQHHSTFTTLPTVSIYETGTMNDVAAHFEVPELPQTSSQVMILALIGIAGNTEGRPLEVFYTFTQQGIDNTTVSASASETAAQPTTATTTPTATSASAEQFTAASAESVAASGAAGPGSAVSITVPTPSDNTATTTSTVTSAAVSQQTARYQQSSETAAQQQSTQQQQQSTGSANESSVEQQNTAMSSTNQPSAGALVPGQQSAQAGTTTQQQTAASTSTATQFSNNNNNNTSLGNNNIQPNIVADNCHGQQVVVGNTVLCSDATSHTLATAIAAAMMAALALL